MKLFETKNKRNLEKEIDSVLDEMSYEHSDTDKYGKMAENLEHLLKAKSYENSAHISKDVLVSGAFSLAGILLIVNYEQLNPLISKALPFVKKI